MIPAAVAAKDQALKMQAAMHEREMKRLRGGWFRRSLAIVKHVAVGIAMGVLIAR